jgi:polar amino acid transport system permease protein
MGLWTTVWLTLTTPFLAIVLGTAVALTGRIDSIVIRGL